MRSDMPLVRMDEEKDNVGELLLCECCCSMIGRVCFVTNDELRLGGLIFVGVCFMTTVISKIGVDTPGM